MLHKALAPCVIGTMGSLSPVITNVSDLTRVMRLERPLSGTGQRNLATVLNALTLLIT